MRLPIFVLIEMVLGLFEVPALVGYTFKVRRCNTLKGISGRAYEPLFGRMLMQNAGTRRDEAALRIVLYLPALSPAIAALLGSLGPAVR